MLSWQWLIIVKGWVSRCMTAQRNCGLLRALSPRKSLWLLLSDRSTISYRRRSSGWLLRCRIIPLAKQLAKLFKIAHIPLIWTWHISFGDLVADFNSLPRCIVVACLFNLRSLHALSSLRTGSLLFSCIIKSLMRGRLVEERWDGSLVLGGGYRDRVEDHAMWWYILFGRYKCLRKLMGYWRPGSLGYYLTNVLVILRIQSSTQGGIVICLWLRR